MYYIFTCYKVWYLCLSTKTLTISPIPVIYNTLESLKILHTISSYSMEPFSKTENPTSVGLHMWTKGTLRGIQAWVGSHQSAKKLNRNNRSYKALRVPHKRNSGGACFHLSSVGCLYCPLPGKWKRRNTKIGNLKEKSKWDVPKHNGSYLGLAECDSGS